ncbi:peroxisomal adenine nucleotide transporter 1 [Corynascus novoguineensis]|uniref:Peroxisomal adenine nucleotide transporter 1 n=1 Tax=Corynascus novoguineensis TaxID=1126955 RepID=A0AAN7D127_9PEZI|nr:peroxisomal adenine nucleotide transporter 1 [Corynascus novoguineensis]
MPSSSTTPSPSSSASKLLPALGHAASGAAGTVVSTAVTYPLDLVNTRLKVQRQLYLEGAIGPDDTYTGVADAFRAIYAREGGVCALFAGLGADVVKSAADSFLFFLFYTWFRSRRLASNKHGLPHLHVAEELAVGAAAGACAKLFTTPVSNVVTQRQTASLLEANSEGGDDGSSSDDSNKDRTARDRSFGEIVAELRRERGVLGLWAGYSANLVLTLNPSITFFLQQVLKRALVPRERWDEPGARTTFFLAAVSKVVATAATYPFQIAKARVQVSAAPEKRRGKSKVRDNIFATVLRIARVEGGRALYDGIGGELLKGFFNHGTTMLSKDVIHRFIVQLYFAILAILERNPHWGSKLSGRVKKVREEARERYLRVSSSGVEGVRRGVHYVRSAVNSGQNAPATWLRAVKTAD